MTSVVVASVGLAIFTILATVSSLVEAQGLPEHLWVPTLTVVPHMTNVDIQFFVYIPWTNETDYSLTISSGTDYTGNELCSQPFTCPNTVCTIKSDDYCDPLPACTNIFVEVSGEGEVSYKASKTLCSTTTVEPTEATTGESSKTTTTTATTEVSTTASCGGDYDGIKGTISSENYPEDYPNDVTCIWTVTGPPNTIISVTIEDFNLDSNDYLEFRDGNNRTAEFLSECTGSSCSDVITSRNALYLEFYSDYYYGTERGFKLIWSAGLPNLNCHICDTHPGNNQYDPACGKNNYNGHNDYSNLWNACYTNIHYVGHRVERGGTENYEVEGTCFDTGYSLTCYCMGDLCNNQLCQNCSSTIPPSISTTPTHITPSMFPTSTTTQPSSILTTYSPNTSPSLSTTSSNPPTSTHSSTPAGPLACYSCTNCQGINEFTHVETSDNFLSCFTSNNLGFVIRGGSPDLYEDGSCHNIDEGTYECYCTSNRCNSEAMDILFGDF